MKNKTSFLAEYTKAYFKRKSPSYLVFFVTARCNSRCSFCFFWESIKKGKTSDELNKNQIEIRAVPQLNTTHR